MNRLLLEYRRVEDMYAFKASYMFLDKPLEYEHSAMPFDRMIKAVSVMLQTDCPDAMVVLRRTDRPGLEDLVLDAQSRDLLRDSPERYADTTELDRLVIVRTLPAEARTVSLAVRFGGDTIADSFGDTVCVRLRDDLSVECPICGRWSARAWYGQLLCCPCNPDQLAVQVTGQWVEVKTKLLTSLSYGRYYLPRSWNPRGWISRDKLTTKYLAYLQESAHV